MKREIGLLEEFPIAWLRNPGVILVLGLGFRVKGLGFSG